MATRGQKLILAVYGDSPRSVRARENITAALEARGIIKLDMSLTRDVDTDSRRQALAAALSEFARRAGCKIVAEGVETEGELDMLRSIGPMFGQGYLFAKPQEPHVFGSEICRPRKFRKGIPNS